MKGILLVCLKLEMEKKGGVQARIRNYVTHLPSLGYQPSVLALSPEKIKTTNSYLSHPLYQLYKRNVFNILTTMLYLLINQDISCVHIIEGTTGIGGLVIMVLAKLFRKKTGISVYSGELVDLRAIKGPLLRRAIFFALVTLTDKIAVNSRATAGLLPGYAKKILVVPPGASMELLHQTTNPSPFHAKQKLLFVGRHFRRKGIDDILLALVIISRKIADIECIFVGGDVMTSPDRLTYEMKRFGINNNSLTMSRAYSLTDFYKRLAKNLNVAHLVTFAGKQQNLSRFYAHADIVLLPSKAVIPVEGYEGFGNVLLEAALFKKPTIGTTHFGIPEAIIHNKTGVLVPENNPRRLASAIASLLGNPTRMHKLGLTGYARVMKNYTDLESTKSFIRLYQ